MLLRELGRGAIGIVYAAYDESLDRKLAIKVLNKARAGRADLEARLRREARALAKLSHPNVVQVYDVGELDGRVFIVMEFVEGRTLSDWMDADHSLDTILAMFADAGRGLAAAHAAGVIHRDFKPDNVIVGADGRPRVLDFGLARAVGSEPRIAEGEAIEQSEPEPTPEPEPAPAGDPSPAPETTSDEPAPRSALVLPSRDPGELPLDERTCDTDIDVPLDLTEVDGDAVRPSDELSSDEAQFDITVRSEPGVDAGGDALTRTGARMGTPAYMSPEQFLAKPVDPSSDQFSFCVALHEAVYGRRPYPARTQSELAVQVHAGAILPAPPDSPVPEWLREVIVRGLSPNRADRWASMAELIAAIERRPEPRPRPRWLIPALAGVLALAIVGAMFWGRERAAACPTREAAQRELWSRERADVLARAFLDSRLSYAEAARAGVELRLDAWASSFAEQRVAACEAGRDPSSGVDTLALDRRQACLARHRRAFEALVGQFAEADPSVIEGAIEAAAALPEPARCSEADALFTRVDAPPPAIAGQVAELRNHLAELDTRLRTGRWEVASTLAAEAVEQARALGYGPVLAEALLTHGRLLAQSGHSSAGEALEQLSAALDQADRSGHEQVVPIAATELVSLSIYAKPDPIRGRLWARRALTSLDRLARERGELGLESDAELGLARARGIWALGNLERLDGDNEQAEADLREALALLDAHAPGHPDRGVMLNDLGNALAARGDHDAAREVYEQALRASVSSLGAGHPRVGNARYNLARLAQEAGDLEAAREQADLAFVIYAAARGPEHRDVGAVAILRAAIELESGEIAAAREHASKAEAIYDAVLGLDNIDRAEPHQMLGHVAFASGQFEQAIVEYRDALKIKRAALPPGHVELVPTLTNLGLVYFTRGEKQLEAGGAPEAAHADFDAAVVELDQAVALLEPGAGVDPERLRAHRLFLGDALLHRGDPGDYERALAMLEAGLEGCEDDPHTCAMLALRAAQTWAKLGERSTAQRRARAAKQGFEALGPDAQAQLREAEALLR